MATKGLSMEVHWTNDNRIGVTVQSMEPTWRHRGLLGECKAPAKLSYKLQSFGYPDITDFCLYLPGATKRRDHEQPTKLFKSAKNMLTYLTAIGGLIEKVNEKTGVSFGEIWKTHFTLCGDDLEVNFIRDKNTVIVERYKATGSFARIPQVLTINKGETAYKFYPSTTKNKTVNGNKIQCNTYTFDDEKSAQKAMINFMAIIPTYGTSIEQCYLKIKTKKTKGGTK